MCWRLWLHDLFKRSPTCQSIRREVFFATRSLSSVSPCQPSYGQALWGLSSVGRTSGHPPEVVVCQCSKWAVFTPLGISKWSHWPITRNSFKLVPFSVKTWSFPKQLEKLGILPIKLRSGLGQPPETWHHIPQGSTKVPLLQVPRFHK